jgi:hypothetical protein
MISIFGIRPTLDELVTRSVNTACAHYGFDPDPRLVKMIVDQTKRDMIRAYVYGRIGHTETLFVPMKGKRQYGDEYADEDCGVAA